jgi:probable phosphoglycerate mutase
MPGLRLGALGKKSARQLADKLGKYKIAGIWSSPLERAVQTALPIARATGAPVHWCHSLIEVDYGDWTGKTFEELSADPRWEHFNTCRELARIPSGEAIEEVRSRILLLLEELCQKHRGALMAIVTHAELIRVALDHYLGRVSDPKKQPHVAPASVSIVQLEPITKVLVVGCKAAHLQRWLSHSV